MDHSQEYRERPNPGKARLGGNIQTAQANAFSFMVVRVTLTNHRRLTPKINGVRIKGIGGDGQDKSQDRGCFSIRRTRGNPL